MSLQAKVAQQSRGPVGAPPRLRRTIRSKLIVLVITPLALAVALITGMSTWRYATGAAELESDRLTYAAQTLAAFGAEAVQTGDSEAAFSALRAISQIEDVNYARLETLDGRVLAETGAGARLASDASLRAGERLSFRQLFGAQTIELREPVLQGGRRVGTVVVLSESHGALSRARSGLAVTGFGASAAAILGLLVAFRLQRGISAPIVGLTQAMSSVRASHDYTLEAELESDDEVGDLVVGFNQMLHEIRDRDARLAGHMQTLEREVAERTAEIRVAKDAAEAANASKSEFLATMSHEIRTPMNGIMVMAEMLASADIPQRQRRYAQVIAKSGQSLLSIINDILDFSKIEAGKMDLESVPVDLADLVDDVTSLFWERARSKSIDLAAYVDPAVPRAVLSDPVRLRQVIGNLVNNAIKFTETGGVLIRVEQASPGAIRVSIQDTGIGIPAAKIDQLFEAFTQADQSTTRRFGGTGLGLAICKRLIDAMGGRIAASSQEGKGSTFSFMFPAQTAEPAQPWPVLSGELAQATLACSGLSTRWALARYLHHSGVQLNASATGFFLGEPQGFGALPRPAICLAEYGDPEPFDRLKARALDAVLVQPFRRSELETVLTRLRDGGSLEDLHVDDSPTASVTPRFEGRRVLVADDSAVNREVAIEALSRLGAKALVVVDGKKAVEAVCADPAIDLVLMDGSMPEMDGYDASRAIRQHERLLGGRRLPIVALTADVVGAGSDAWRKAEMDAILHKPFTLAALADTLSKFMQPSGFGPAAGAEETGSYASEALLDPAVTRELAAMAADGKSDFVEKVRGLYRANAPQSLALARGAFEAGDGEGLARAAHALKSMSFNVGAKKVAALCSTLETLGRSGEPVSSGALMQLSDALDATLEALGGPVAKAPLTNEALLLADLKAAIGAGELYMVYQAQMDRLGQELVGCEALIRWTHPERGAVSPAEFVPLAEKAGMISELTDFVVRRVCADMRAFPTLRVAFNASALEFSKPNFAERLAALIAEQNFDPNRLEVEITETAVVDDADAARANIVKLREMGIKVALDDFGAGYTSLRFLRMFPFDKLKIDREFIQDCETDAEAATIVHAVVAIGRALGMKVVAEGVETEAQRNFLKVAGVHALQGWLFGKAIPPQELALKYGLETKPVPRRVA